MNPYEQQNPNNNQNYPNENPNNFQYREEPEVNYNQENHVSNIVSQIDPIGIIDNFNNALQGKYFNKERGRWEKAGNGKPLVNDACRGWIISYLTSLMNNASTMAIVSEKQFSGLMMGVIRNVGREFITRLEEFGFVPPGPGYANGDFMNRGTPDSSRMDTIAELIYQRAFLIYSRSLNGMESRKIFSSLSMSDPMMFQQQQKRGWVHGLFGGG